MALSHVYSTLPLLLQLQNSCIGTWLQKMESTVLHFATLAPAAKLTYWTMLPGHWIAVHTIPSTFITTMRPFSAPFFHAEKWE